MELCKSLGFSDVEITEGDFLEWAKVAIQKKILLSMLLLATLPLYVINS
jgi:hypothetical protein